MLFIGAKSTLRTAEVQCKRESPVRARLKLRSIHAISTEDPGRFFRDLGGGPKSTMLQKILPRDNSTQSKYTTIV